MCGKRDTAPITSEMDEARSLAIADLDEDGDMDVVVAANGNDRIAWFENVGNLQFFSQSGPILETNNPTSVAVGDLDGDHHPDIVSGVQGGSVSQIIFHENRSGRGVCCG